MRRDLSRRDFLAACGVLGSSFACSQLSLRTRVASSFVVDPSLEDYRAPLRGLIETVLPVGAPDFPLELPFVEKRLLRMFPLEDERRFLGFQRTLMYFDQLDLAPHAAAPLLASERIALDVPVRLSESAFRTACAEKSAAEEEACRSFFAGNPDRHARFSALPPDARLRWLEVWSGSQFTVKRDFAHSIRILIFMTAYSSDRVWPTIGYDGPLMPGPERET